MKYYGYVYNNKIEGVKFYLVRHSWCHPFIRDINKYGSKSFFMQGSWMDNSKNMVKNKKSLEKVCILFDKPLPPKDFA